MALDMDIEVGYSSVNSTIGHLRIDDSSYSPVKHSDGNYYVEDFDLNVVTSSDIIFDNVSFQMDGRSGGTYFDVVLNTTGKIKFLNGTNLTVEAFRDASFELVASEINLFGANVLIGTKYTSYSSTTVDSDIIFRADSLSLDNSTVTSRSEQTSNHNRNS